MKAGQGVNSQSLSQEMKVDKPRDSLGLFGPIQLQPLVCYITKFSGGQFRAMEDIALASPMSCQDVRRVRLKRSLFRPQALAGE
jgi:hypothetical protein